MEQEVPNINFGITDRPSLIGLVAGGSFNRENLAWIIRDAGRIGAAGVA